MDTTSLSRGLMRTGLLSTECSKSSVRRDELWAGPSGRSHGLATFPPCIAIFIRRPRLPVARRGHRPADLVSQPAAMMH
jgi:hypothetical protein